MTRRLLWCWLLAVQAVPALSAQAPVTRSLAQRLEFAPAAIVLMVNGDDVGVSHAANQASIASLERGLMTSASIMVQAPWFPEIAAYARAHPGAEFELFTNDASIRELFEQKRVTRIGCRALRDLQRGVAR